MQCVPAASLLAAASCWSNAPHLSTIVIFLCSWVPPCAHSEHDGEAVTCLIPISQAMQLPFIHLTVRRPTRTQRPGVLPSPKITPRPRRRRHGLSYKQLVAAAVPAAPAGRPSPEAQGPGLAWIPGLSSESPILSGPFFDPACLPQCGSPPGMVNRGLPLASSKDRRQ